MSKRLVVRKISLGLIGGLGAMMAVSAMAAGYSETVVRTSAEGIRSATVPYDDLDLSSHQGRSALAGRVNHAARMVCGPVDMRRAGSLRQATENRECQGDAVATAMEQVNSGQLAAISQ